MPQPPDVPAAPASSDDPSTVGLVTAYLDDQRAALIAGDAALRTGDLAAVHPTRVASRRFRSVLRALTPLFDENEAMVLEESLRWWGRVLGRARDVEIISGQLAEALDQLPAPDELTATADGPIQEHLASRAEQARAGIAKALARPRYATMMRRIEALHDDPAVAGAQVSAGELVRHVAGAVERHRELLRVAADDEERLHDARKAAKDARYLAELARPALGAPAEDVVREMTEAQDRLGARQDRVTVRAFVRELDDAAERGEIVLDGPDRRVVDLLRSGSAVDGPAPR